MWYVVQTTTGKEQDLVDLVHKMLPRNIYKECFFLKRQLLKRLGGKWLEVTETLFPAYVFLDAKLENAEKIFFQLKGIPEFTKLLGDGQGEFIPLEKEEVEFLRILIQRSRNSTVDMSMIKLNEYGGIREIDGPLEYFRDQVVQINLRKRYALIRVFIGREQQNILIGIFLEKDAKSL